MSFWLWKILMIWRKWVKFWYQWNQLQILFCAKSWLRLLLVASLSKTFKYLIQKGFFVIRDCLPELKIIFNLLPGFSFQVTRHTSHLNVKLISKWHVNSLPSALASGTFIDIFIGNIYFLYLLASTWLSWLQRQRGRRVFMILFTELSTGNGGSVHFINLASVSLWHKQRKKCHDI